ncbi:MAG: hypothetical protein ACI8WB_000544 [Phenylobacterium sp.]|jgi:hypothetical protein
MSKIKLFWCSFNRPTLALIGVLTMTFAIVTTTVSWSVDAKTNQQTKTRYRAAFIFQMAKYVHWSIPKNAPLTFCFFPTSQKHSIITVLSELKASGKLKVQDRQVNIKTIAEDKVDIIEHYQDCSLIYFDHKTSPQLPPALITKLSKTKLTIGSKTAFMNSGGLSALILKKGKLKLYINRASYKTTAVRIRSRLLALVRFHPE